MHQDSLKELLAAIRSGRVGVDEALDRLRHMPFEALDFANIDHHRALRCGFPEVLFCLGKTPKQAAEIFDRMARAGGNVLATRATPEQAAAIRQLVPDAVHHELARCVTHRPRQRDLSKGTIALVAAGTSDLPVLEEARVTCEIMDQRTQCIADVGVAGVHRVLTHVPALQAARVVVVVAGMDGALPSVVSGLVSAPIIAVPTSVGYGAHFQGLAPLLTMLNSCAPGVAVVNIDNGFAAGYLASMINRLAEDRGE